MQTLPSTRTNILLRFLVGIIIALMIGLGLFYLMMQPPLNEMGLMTGLMGGTGLISVAAAYLGYRSGWITRSPHLRWTLAAGYLLAGLVAFLNVWITARMMFASQHDLVLATILLIFATGVAIAVGLFLSEAITARIQQLNTAAQQVADGHLDTRISVNGRDEMALLASSFNEMVTQLQSAEQKKAELETMRSDLIAWVGHDLRTPLTSIRAIVEALADGIVEDEPTRSRYLRTAQADIASLSNLIDDLFEMSQIDAGGLHLDIEPVFIPDLISDTMERFSEQARRKGIQIEGSTRPDIKPVLADAQQIERVLVNLVSNAVHYTPSGGNVQVTAEQTGNQLQISVQDTGEGIRSEDLPYIFERFYRGEKSRSRATGGAGLGLAIARGIVEAHGGSVGVESQPGKGTRVWFCLPYTFNSPPEQSPGHPLQR